MSFAPELLDTDYRKLRADDSPFEVSERVQSPVLKIFRENGRYVARLGVNLRRDNGREFISCLSIKHNWVLDGGTVKPLPHDAPEFLAEALVGIDSHAIRFPEVLRLARDGIDGIEVVLDSSATEGAKARSEAMSLPADGVNGLRATLYPYQEQGVAWLEEALSQFGGAILADEMGLGKTLQVIALILRGQRGQSNPVLIVCPTTLISNWCREIQRFAPSLSILVHRGAGRTGYYKGLLSADLCVTTYDTMVIDISLFRSVEWSLTVYDEAQALKNPESKRRKAAASLVNTYTIPVTGTPVENSLMDLWSLADIAIPGVLGSSGDFSNRYPDDEDAALNLSLISDSFVLKRQVKDVAGDLPDRTDVDLPIPLSDRAINDYERIRKETIEEYGAAGRLVAVGQLALYCAHPWLRRDVKEMSDGWEDRVSLEPDKKDALITPKMEVCLQLLREAFANRRKVLIFALYNNCGGLIRQAALEVGLPIEFWGSINGSTPASDRQAIVDEFSDASGSCVLMLNPKAAGAGLNITKATVVIHYTQYWNPALDSQASARAHRRGQEHPVTIYRLYYEDTVEQTMVERCAWKRELGESAVPIKTREKRDLATALFGGSAE